MTHEERYQYLVEHQVGGTVTNYYRSAFYLLSAKEELFEKSKDFASNGIEFSAIKKKFHWEEERLLKLVEIAENLYTAVDKCNITPRQIAILPQEYLAWVIQAMHIAGGYCAVNIIDGHFLFENLTVDSHWCFNEDDLPF